MRPPRTRRRRDPARLRRPVAVAALAVLGAVLYVSYHANSGLPWQSTYRISAEVADASRLQRNDDVRISGVRVGRVAEVTAEPPGPRGRASVRLELALQPGVGPLASDSTVRIRPSSVLGASYVDLTPGNGPRKVRAGGDLGRVGGAPAMDLTDLFDVFDDSTSRAIRSTLDDLGDGLAGRGTAVNATLANLARTLGPLTRVAGTLADRRTRLPTFLRAYATFATALAPVGGDLADLVGSAARTLGAVGHERPALDATLRALPGAEESLTDALTRLRPGLEGLAGVMADLRPAVRLLPGTLRQINATARAGVPAFAAVRTIAAPLEATLSALGATSRRAATAGTLRQLTQTAASATTTLEVLTPAQVYCNGIPLYGFPGTIDTLGSRTGPAAAFVTLTDLGAQLETLQNPKPSPDVAINYLPHENAHECESGNEQGDNHSQILVNPPGDQSRGVPATRPPADAYARAGRAGLVDLPAGSR